MEERKKKKIGNHTSQALRVEYGVPQGTVLGPFLFSAYINGILSILDDDRVFCFADDTVVVSVGDTWGSTIKEAEISISKVKTWLDYSLLTLNIDKTRFIPFALTRRALPDCKTLKIHKPNCEHVEATGGCDCGGIERVQNLKYLGVFIDEKLNWKKHLEYTTKKVRRLIYKFYELRNVLPTNVCKMVYYSLVESILDYGIIVWGGACKTVLSSLNVAQKYIIKIMMFKNKRYPSDLLFKESKLLTLHQLYVRRIIRFMLTSQNYKYEIGHSLHTRNATKCNLGLSSVIHVSAKRHISFVGPRVYNALPNSLRTKPYKNVKTQIHNWLVETQFCYRF